MNSRSFSSSDFAFFEELAEASPGWAKEELDGNSLERYMSAYDV